MVCVHVERFSVELSNKKSERTASACVHDRCQTAIGLHAKRSDLYQNHEFVPPIRL
jgi:hypothetical protein